MIIRKSGTENCIRIMVEAKENKIVDNMSLQIKNYINDKLKTLWQKKLSLQIGKITEVENS